MDFSLNPISSTSTDPPNFSRQNSESTVSLTYNNQPNNSQNTFYESNQIPPSVTFKPVVSHSDDSNKIWKSTPIFSNVFFPDNQTHSTAICSLICQPYPNQSASAVLEEPTTGLPEQNGSQPSSGGKLETISPRNFHDIQPTISVIQSNSSEMDLPSELMNSSPESSQSINSYSESINPSTQSINPSSESANPSPESINLSSESINPSPESINQSHSELMNSSSESINTYFESINHSSESINPSTQSINSYSESINLSSESINPSTQSINQSHSEYINYSPEYINYSPEYINSYSESINPSSKSINPSSESANPSTESINPSTESINPSTEYINQSHSELMNSSSGYINQSSESNNFGFVNHPSTRSTNPSTLSTNPSTQFIDNSTQSANPSTQFIDNSTQSINPSTQSINPFTETKRTVDLDLNGTEGTRKDDFHRKSSSRALHRTPLDGTRKNSDRHFGDGTYSQPIQAEENRSTYFPEIFHLNSGRVSSENVIANALISNSRDIGNNRSIHDETFHDGVCSSLLIDSLSRERSTNSIKLGYSLERFTPINNKNSNRCSGRQSSRHSEVLSSTKQIDLFKSGTHRSSFERSVVENEKYPIISQLKKPENQIYPATDRDLTHLLYYPGSSEVSTNQTPLHCQPFDSCERNRACRGPSRDQVQEMAQPQCIEPHRKIITDTKIRQLSPIKNGSTKLKRISFEEDGDFNWETSNNSSVRHSIRKLLAEVIDSNHCDNRNHSPTSIPKKHDSKLSVTRSEKKLKSILKTPTPIGQLVPIEEQKRRDLRHTDFHSKVNRKSPSNENGDLLKAKRSSLHQLSKRSHSEIIERQNRPSNIPIRSKSDIISIRKPSSQKWNRFKESIKKQRTNLNYLNSPLENPHYRRSRFLSNQPSTPVLPINKGNVFHRKPISSSNGRAKVKELIESIRDSPTINDSVTQSGQVNKRDEKDQNRIKSSISNPQRKKAEVIETELDKLNI